MEGGTVGEIRWFSGYIVPKWWASCEGQQLAIASYPSLYSVLGTRYGGDGRTTFGLPDMRGRVAIGVGKGEGLSNYVLGRQGGSNSVALTTAELPAHTHSVISQAHIGKFALKCNADEATTDDPTGAYLALSDIGDIYSTSSNNITMSTQDINVDTVTGTITCGETGSTGGSFLPHSNIQPMCVLQFIICTQGAYPERS
ncbi:MAG: tail fiber protein [Flavipsychrobacter sp.]